MLFKFQIELSDIDRNIYESLEFRTAQHLSETGIYLLTRVIAYLHCYQSNLEFSLSGLSDPEGPTLFTRGDNGSIQNWIEIGNPSSKKLHKATKQAPNILVYTYKSPQVLINDIVASGVHRAKDIQIFAVATSFLESLERDLIKNNRWSVLIQQGQIDITVGSSVHSTEIQKFAAAN